MEPTPNRSSQFISCVVGDRDSEYALALQFTNGFSKEVEDRHHILVVQTIWHNFVEMRKTLRTMPAITLPTAGAPL